MQTVVKALIHDSAGNVLILRRSETHPDLALEPDLPGGLCESGENIHEALHREIYEETNLIIDSYKIVFGRVSKYGYLHILFIGKIPREKPDIAVSWEHDRYEWIPLNMVKSRIQGKDEYSKTVRSYLTFHSFRKSIATQMTRLIKARVV